MTIYSNSYYFEGAKQWTNCKINILEDIHIPEIAELFFQHHVPPVKQENDLYYLLQENYQYIL